MTVAVIGGAGFIGSNLVDELATMGHEVNVLDNLSEGKVENLCRWRDDPKSKVNFTKGDIRNYSDVVKAVSGCSWVFHLAAMSRIQPSIENPVLAFEQNVMGTVNVMEACRKYGVKRVVYSASSSAYGLANKTPNYEDQRPDCLNAYSLSKKAGEEIADLYHRLYGLSTVSLRYFNVFGPRHQEEGSYSTVIAIFRKQKRRGQKLTVVGDGLQRRDFTFVGDVVRANVLAAMNLDVHGVFNIGYGRNYNILDVAELVLGNGGLSPDDLEYLEPRLGEARETLADNSKARGVLGWKPQVSLKEGLVVLDQYERVNPPSSIIVRS
ncbi:MAG: NAD-dependent epimerase/dehydratase family protein [Acidiferrobacterales bacterium]